MILSVQLRYCTLKDCYFEEGLVIDDASNTQKSEKSS